MKKAGYILLAAVMVGAFWWAGSLNDDLLHLRKTHQLNQTDPLENSPPLVTFTTIALSGFRGVMVDYLWIRAHQLQQEGRYFELVQLSDWITKLQPRSSSIWVFHSWNLAYNISLLMADHADRWRWVNHGISLIRDKGLHYNPGEARLYSQLAWIYMHKLGETADRAHEYYRKALSEEMEKILPSPVPDFSTYDVLPKSEEAVMSDPAMAELLAFIHSEGFEPFSYDLLDSNKLSPALWSRLQVDPQGMILRQYLQYKVLKEVYKLDPARMKMMHERYGPLDWRLFHAHTIYWARAGQDYGDGKLNTLLDVNIFYSMVKAYYTGSVFFSKERMYYFPRPQLMPGVSRVMMERMMKLKTDNAKIAYDNFLQESVFVAYIYGQGDLAKGLYKEMIEKLSDDVADPVSMDAFLQDYLSQQLKRPSYNRMLLIVDGVMQQYYTAKERGDTKRSKMLLKMTKDYWELYEKALKDDPRLKYDVSLPPLEIFHKYARSKIITSR